MEIRYLLKHRHGLTGDFPCELNNSGVRTTVALCPRLDLGTKYSSVQQSSMGQWLFSHESKQSTELSVSICKQPSADSSIPFLLTSHQLDSLDLFGLWTKGTVPGSFRLCFYHHRHYRHIIKHHRLHLLTEYSAYDIFKSQMKHWWILMSLDSEVLHTNTHSWRYSDSVNFHLYLLCL